MRRRPGMAGVLRVTQDGAYSVRRKDVPAMDETSK